MGDSVLVFDGAGRGKDNQEIYRVRLRDLKVTRLTFDSVAFDAVANVGPVSGRILFDSNRSIDKLSDVWVMEGDGTNQRQLSNGANSYGHAAWSPDETRIAYRAKLSEKNHEIQLMNPQGTEVLWVSGLKAMSQHPSWSKDGKKLVFSSNAAGVYALYIFDLTTGNLTQVGFTKQGNLYRPSFSADGNSILYCEEKTKKWQVRLLDLKSGTARTLVDH